MNEPAMNQRMERKAASIPRLKEIARKRLPKYIFDYLQSGCISDSALRANRQDLERIKLVPDYLSGATPADLSCEILAQNYRLPIGIAPIGLSGLIWPRSAEYLAAAAKQAGIPFVLSTVASTCIEKAAELAEENFWFQLYPPPDQDNHKSGRQNIRQDLIKRAHSVGCKNLVVTIDVPALGRRPRDLQNGIAIPPKLSFRNLIESIACPSWGLSTLATGLPEFACVENYLGDIKGMKNRAYYVRSVFKEVVDQTLLKQVRDEWQHNLIVKGILTPQDAALAKQCGADAIWISNHGGRQLDAAPSTISVLRNIAESTAGAMPIIADSGVESGTDIARFLAHGADMVFAGRAFMYGVAALGKPGAAHAINILKAELLQTVNQLGCHQTRQLADRIYAPHLTNP